MSHAAALRTVVFTTAIAFSANAALATTATEEALVDAVNGVTVIEKFDGFAAGSFEVINNSATEILLFAVSNPNNDPGASTTRAGWTGTGIEKEDWNSDLNGIEVFSLANGEQFSVAEGAFESFFGDSDQSALVYHNNGVLNPIAPGETTEEFTFFTIAVASDFIAVDSSGTVFSGSFTPATVPLPASLPLFGSAICGLLLLRRRRKA